MPLRLSKAEAQRLGLVPGRGRQGAKYRNKPQLVDGLRFDSGGEAQHWFGVLKVREKLGEIRELERQVRYKLPVNDGHVATMVVDFQWVEAKTGVKVVADFKSPATLKNRAFRIKYKLMQQVHGITVQLIGRKGPLQFSAAGRRARERAGTKP
jgi:hypothetical protein